jgi:hypothetical protein
MTYSPKPYVAPALIGNLKQLLLLPCTIPPSAYIETGIPEAISMFETLILGQMEHEVKHALGGSLRHQLQTAAAEAQEGTPAFGQGTNKLIFDVSGLAGSAFMYLYFASVVSHGLTRWTSQILKMTKCPGMPSSFTGFSRSPYGAVFGPGQRRNLCFDWINDNPNPLVPPGLVPAVTVGGGRTGLVICSAQAQDINGRPCPLTTSLENLTTGEVLQTSTGAENSNGTYQHSTIMMTLPNPTATIMHYGVYGVTQPNLPTDQAFPRSGYLMCTSYKGIEENVTPGMRGSDDG